MFMFLKVLTQSGRRELAREALREYCTPAKIAELCANGATFALEAGAARMKDERCMQIADGCRMCSTALTHVTEAIDPRGDGGKQITEVERNSICGDIYGGVKLLVSQEQLDNIAAEIVKRVP